MEKSFYRLKEEKTGKECYIEIRGDPNLFEQLYKNEKGILEKITPVIFVEETNEEMLKLIDEMNKIDEIGFFAAPQKR